jgi:hypothetical protein
MFIVRTWNFKAAKVVAVVNCARIRFSADLTRVVLVVSVMEIVRRYARLATVRFVVVMVMLTGCVTSFLTVVVLVRFIKICLPACSTFEVVVVSNVLIGFKTDFTTDVAVVRVMLIVRRYARLAMVVVVVVRFTKTLKVTSFLIAVAVERVISISLGIIRPPADGAAAKGELARGTVPSIIFPPSLHVYLRQQPFVQ